MSPLNAPFAELLSAARETAGLTQEELADRSGLDRTTVYYAEAGKGAPRLETLVRLAGGLGVDPCSLIPAIRWKPPETTPTPGRFEPA